MRIQDHHRKLCYVSISFVLAISLLTGGIINLLSLVVLKKCLFNTEISTIIILHVIAMYCTVSGFVSCHSTKPGYFLIKVVTISGGITLTSLLIQLITDMLAFLYKENFL